MPSRYVLREYEDGHYYHIFNRGVEKRDIFIDEKDYKVFLYYLKSFLTPPDLLDEEDPFANPSRKNFSARVKLVCFCLMPNHYHMMIQQLNNNGVADFMKALSNAYTRYFNDRYERVGSLFQGRFKAARIDSDSYYYHISRYIHDNPKDIGKDPFKYSYSSLVFFTQEQIVPPIWLDPLPALESIGSREKYRKFMGKQETESIPKEFLPDSRGSTSLREDGLEFLVSNFGIWGMADIAADIYYVDAIFR